MAAIIARSLRRPLFSSISKHLLLKSHIRPPSSPSFFHRLPPPRTTVLRHPRSPSFSTSTVAVDNPILKTFEFPPFDAIDASHVRPGIRALLKELDGDLIELERTVEPTWPKLVEPLEKMKDRLSVAWGAVNHLKAVKDSSEFRSAIEDVQPEKVEFDLKLGQSKPIYNAFKAIRESFSWEGLSDAQKRVVESSLKEAVLNGVSLEDSKREEFNKIQQELTKLSRKFEENVFDSTKKFEKLITDKKEIEGLPVTALGLAAQTASSKGHENATAENGPWMITLDDPSVLLVIQHAKNRALREEIYRAYVTRASSGEHDNTQVIEQILKLRLEKAKLLGYNNYAEVSMETKMATVSKAEELLEKLRSASWNAAVQGAPEADELTHWDTVFWSERLCESKYEINEVISPRIMFTNSAAQCYYYLFSDINFLILQEELRPYFSLSKVMDGLFNLMKMLFGIDVEPADGYAPIWNADVKFYRLKHSSGKPISYFYFDPYIRPAEKRSGAWMDEVVARRVLSHDKTSVRLPIAHMVCNQMPPVGDKPSLMTFHEVKTVFHEFGHALQHMLTKQDEGLVSGIRGIEWDAIELPSQFMENWCYHRTFRAGSLSLCHIKLATVDLELHSKYVPGGSESIYDVDRRISEKTEVIPPLPEDRFLCSFIHIFSGAYAAGYYSYKWAEVLSADAFSAFEDAGLHDEKVWQPERRGTGSVKLFLHLEVEKIH
ncbi:hypothetical protein L1987_74815 [Smallanthus sonchifolius]|uniref:Uncharacterized protein n=1 Tax=Smallanthus sonchifolius TaxID=185202 RepID=A0ACB9A843_9ASTR|nr:hypothetical protein L1987_74815 [Smallanthus sonchifolius]